MLLNNQWILTAKHIVEGASASTIKISLGHNNPSTDTNRLSISQIVFYSSLVDDDIALLKLSSPVTFSSNIAPIYISSGTSYTINTSCEVTGWGRTSINGSSPNPQLKRCEVSLQSCSGKNIYTKPSSNTPFKGDSGGALTIDASGYKMAIGIVAGGDSDNPTSTSVRYMNIGYYYDWIASHVDLYSISGPSVMGTTGTYSFSAPGCTVSVGSTLEIVSQGSNSMLVKYLSKGVGTINIKAGSRTIYQNEFWAGTPVITRIDGPTRTPNAGYANFRAIYDARCNPTKFEWKVNPDPGGPLFGANTAILDVAFYYPGSYQVVVRAQNAAGMGEYRTSGCNVYSASRSLVVYPNPVANTLNIKFDEGENSANNANGQKQYDIKLYNVHGSLKLSTKSSGEQVSLDVSALSEGNYILQISDGVEISVEQIIIRR